MYSCGASWLPTYKLGMLELTGSNPLDPAAWTKRADPVFSSTNETFGVGHSCFVKSPDETQWWHVFHAKRDRQPGWRRAVFVQPMLIDTDDRPQFDYFRGTGYFRDTPEPHMGLGELVASDRRRRRTRTARTMAILLGIGALDVAVGKLVYDRAIERGVGTELPF